MFVDQCVLPPTATCSNNNSAKVQLAVIAHAVLSADVAACRLCAWLFWLPILESPIHAFPGHIRGTASAACMCDRDAAAFHQFPDRPMRFSRALPSIIGDIIASAQ
eukprot:gene2320-5303_t